MSTRTNTRPRPRHLTDQGDGGLFTAIGAAFLAFLVLLGITAALSGWLGDGVGQTVLQIGVVLIVAALALLAVGGGR